MLRTVGTDFSEWVGQRVMVRTRFYDGRVWDHAGLVTKAGEAYTLHRHGVVDLLRRGDVVVAVWKDGDYIPIDSTGSGT